MLDGVLSLLGTNMEVVNCFGRFRWPLKGPCLVRLVLANPLIRADSDFAGWTGLAGRS